jgi:hypothetical protein
VRDALTAGKRGGAEQDKSMSMSKIKSKKNNGVGGEGEIVERADLWGACQGKVLNRSSI